MARGGVEPPALRSSVVSLGRSSPHKWPELDLPAVFPVFCFPRLGAVCGPPATSANAGSAPLPESPGGRSNQAHPLTGPTAGCCGRCTEWAGAHASSDSDPWRGCVGLNPDPAAAGCLAGRGSARLRQVTDRRQLHNCSGLRGSVLPVDEFARSKWPLTQAAVLLREVGSRR